VINRTFEESPCGDDLLRRCTVLPATQIKSRQIPSGYLSEPVCKLEAAKILGNFSEALISRPTERRSGGFGSFSSRKKNSQMLFGFPARRTSFVAKS